MISETWSTTSYGKVIPSVWVVLRLSAMSNWMAAVPVTFAAGVRLVKYSVDPVDSLFGAELESSRARPGVLV